MGVHLALVALLWTASAGAQALPAPAEQAQLRTWIDHSRCVTNNCCFKIDPSEVTELGGGKFRIDATGQEIQARPSRDGKWYRCACDSIDGRWVVHPTARTRCLYVYLGF